MENLQGGTLALDHYYHLDERIRSFGLVTVYAATQDPFDHPVRVTVYEELADAAIGPDIAARIKQSAHIASDLPGEGLLPVVDFGEIEPGVPFVIEQTRPGPSLTRRMEARDVFAPADVAALIGRLASLLQSAHDRGICHGNLTPDWIVFDDDTAPLDSACLAHFGIGPSMRELVALSHTVLTTDLVDSLPPESFDVATRDENEDDEQFDDIELAPDQTPPHLTSKADQWALAALAYRLLVGVHPFFDDPVDASEGILRIKTEDPPALSELGIDPSISDVVDRALSHEPRDRYPSIDAFATAFQGALDGPSTESSPGLDEAAQHSGLGHHSSSSSDRFDEPDELDESIGDLAHPAGPSPPQPSGYLLTGALVALILTNVGWFFWSMNDEPVENEVDDRDVATAEAHTIPTGLQIQTEPSGAELSVLHTDTDSYQSLGNTPQAIPNELLESSRVQLSVAHNEHRNQQLTIEETETGQNIVLQLLEDLAAGAEDAE